MTGTASEPSLRVVHLWRGGPVSYDAALDLQRRLVAQRQDDAIPDTLLLLEHEPVVTHGRLADPAHRLVGIDTFEDRGIELVATDRGGDHTYHGPGQLVGYPIVRLGGEGRDVRTYVRTLEDVLLDAVRAMGVHGAGRADFHAGIWVEDRYLAALGVRVSRGVASHGFALNVDARVHEGFSTIVACGMAGKRVTCLHAEAGRGITMEEAAAGVADAFVRAFGHAAVESRDTP